MSLARRLLTLAPPTALAALALSAAQAPAAVVVFRFTGTITQIYDSSGAPRTLGPIAVGMPFTGTFQYEVNQSPSQTTSGFARYNGACNSWRVSINGQDFYSAPTEATLLNVYSYGSPFPYEGVTVGTGDVVVPSGWSIDHSSFSDSYNFTLQNQPNTGILPNLNPPSSLNLSQWTSTHEMRMDFFNGVTFPGGSYTDRTTVSGNILTVQQQPSITVTTNPTVSAFPTSATFAAGQTATIPMTVSGIGTSPPIFNWRRNGSLIASNPRVHVASTGALTIDTVTNVDMGVYDCVVDYGCGVTILGPVALGVSPAQPCPADFDRNGQIGVQDIFAFLSAWFTGCP